MGFTLVIVVAPLIYFQGYQEVTYCYLKMITIKSIYSIIIIFLIKNIIIKIIIIFNLNFNSLVLIY